MKRVSVMKDGCEKNFTDGEPQGSRPESGSSTRRASFVMTLWLEGANDATTPQWRWRVIDAQDASIEPTYFTKLSELLSYVSERAGVSPPT